MQRKRVLVVDDEAQLRTVLFRALGKRGHSVTTAATCEEALSLSQTSGLLDLFLIDLRLPDGDGIDLMTRLKVAHPNAKFIILTGFATVDIAVEATQKGAYHFVTKPFNLEENSQRGGSFVFSLPA